MRIALAICTYNRAALLDQTLSGLAALEIPPDVTWEVIVVNNNSTDETAVVARRHTVLPLRLVDEPTRGLSHARNRAIRETDAELIVFLDDDVKVDPQLVAEYARAVREWPDAQFFGGTVRPWFPHRPPQWVQRNLEPLSEPYALAQHGETVRPVDSRPIVGANMAFRTASVRQFRFDTRLGKVGGGQMGGEETELMGRMRAAGLQGLWVGTAAVAHYVHPERMTTEYLWRWYAGLGALVATQHGVAETSTFLGAPRWAVRRYCALLVAYWVLCLRRDERWMKAFRAAGLMRGYIQEARRLRTSIRRDVPETAAP